MIRSATQTLRAAAAGTLAVAAVAAQPAYASTPATGTLAVSATVTSNCVVSTTPIAFTLDVTDGQDHDGTGGISVTCTSGTGWSASADAGAGTSATLAVRQMADSNANLLNYALYTDSARTSIWGDGVVSGTAAITGTGSGVAQPTTIYARVPSAQTSLPAGSYTDSVTVTVTY